jgi:hypothetical protein
LTYRASSPYNSPGSWIILTPSFPAVARKRLSEPAAPGGDDIRNIPDGFPLTTLPARIWRCLVNGEEFFAAQPEGELRDEEFASTPVKALYAWDQDLKRIFGNNGESKSLLDLKKGKVEMGKGGRFGKYGEQKRFQRLRQKKKLSPRIIKNLRERKATKR